MTSYETVPNGRRPEAASSGPETGTAFPGEAVIDFGRFGHFARGREMFCDAQGRPGRRQVGSGQRAQRRQRARRPDLAKGADGGFGDQRI